MTGTVEAWETKRGVHKIRAEKRKGLRTVADGSGLGKGSIRCFRELLTLRRSHSNLAEALSRVEAKKRQPIRERGLRKQGGRESRQEDEIEELFGGTTRELCACPGGRQRHCGEKKRNTNKLKNAAAWKALNGHSSGSPRAGGGG